MPTLVLEFLRSASLTRRCAALGSVRYCTDDGSGRDAFTVRGAAYATGGRQNEGSASPNQRQLRNPATPTPGRGVNGAHGVLIESQCP